MKIGILTFHRPINYGAFLQSYSLSSELKRRYPEDQVEIIDYIASLEKKKISMNVLSTAKHYGVMNAFKEIAKIRQFKKSLAFLPLSHRKFFGGSLESLYEYIDSNYDILIIGSDAVFNWTQTDFPTAFIPEYNFKHCLVATYAASVHGMKFYQEEESKIASCQKAFRKMSYIGVRDKNTENFVKYCSPDVTPVHCCDPTCFINLTDVYDKVDVDKLYRKNKILHEDYIVLMLQNSSISKLVYERYHDRYKIISLFKPNKYSDCYMYDLSPFEWVYVLGHAKCVITNYFHGTYLSLVQNVPVVVVDISHYSGEYEGKLFDLMNRRICVPELYFRIEDLDTMLFGDLVDRAIEGRFNNIVSCNIGKEQQTITKLIDAINVSLE